MIGWLLAIVAMFFVYMLADSWLVEYHSFKVMEHERYLAWLEQEGKK